VRSKSWRLGLSSANNVQITGHGGNEAAILRVWLHYYRELLHLCPIVLRVCRATQLIVPPKDTRRQINRSTYTYRSRSDITGEMPFRSSPRSS
jgi:hypothetical protein